MVVEAPSDREAKRATESGRNTTDPPLVRFPERSRAHGPGRGALMTKGPRATTPPAPTDLISMRARLLRLVARLDTELEAIHDDFVCVSASRHPSGEMLRRVAAHLDKSQSLTGDLGDLLDCCDVEHCVEHPYGQCYQCRQPIAPERLHRLPTATLCADCVRA